MIRVEGMKKNGRTERNLTDVIQVTCLVVELQYNFSVLLILYLCSVGSCLFPSFYFCCNLFSPTEKKQDY